MDCRWRSLAWQSRSVLQRAATPAACVPLRGTTCFISTSSKIRSSQCCVRCRAARHLITCSHVLLEDSATSNSQGVSTPGIRGPQTLMPCTTFQLLQARLGIIAQQLAAGQRGVAEAVGRRRRGGALPGRHRRQGRRRAAAGPGAGRRAAAGAVDSCLLPGRCQPLAGSSSGSFTSALQTHEHGNAFSWLMNSLHHACFAAQGAVAMLRP